MSSRTVAISSTPVKLAPRPDSAHSHACPNCGTTYAQPLSDFADVNKRRVVELEAEVKILTLRATAAVDKLADYEDQIQKLKALQRMSRPVHEGPPPDTVASPFSVQSPDEHNGSRSATAGANTSRFSSLLGGSRKQNAQQLHLRDSDLQAALEKEQQLRQKAEGKLNKMNGEIEDLSAQLFQQANEMVAAERKARAKLEERVEILERRDVEKRKRLERLEVALKRIERVKGLLAT